MHLYPQSAAAADPYEAVYVRSCAVCEYVKKGSRAICVREPCQGGDRGSIKRVRQMCRGFACSSMKPQLRACASSSRVLDLNPMSVLLFYQTVLRLTVVTAGFTARLSRRLIRYRPKICYTPEKIFMHQVYTANGDRKTFSESAVENISRTFSPRGRDGRTAHAYLFLARGEPEKPPAQSCSPRRSTATSASRRALR